MKRIEKFEDLEIWQSARSLVRDVYRVSGSSVFARDFGLRDQIRRASVSIMSNIAEGFERGSDKDFARFLYIAKALASEVRSQLYVATDLEYLDESTGLRLQDELFSLSRRVSALIKYLAPATQRVDRD